MAAVSVRWRGLVALLGVLVLAVVSIQVMSTATASAAGLAACPFWASGITPPPRSDTPWTKPLQTAPAVNFSSRLAAPGCPGRSQTARSR